MEQIFGHIAAYAADNHGVVSVGQMNRCGLAPSTRRRWEVAGRLFRLGPRSFTLGGTPPTWERALAAAIADLDGRGFLAGRTAARLHGLDGFMSPDVEALLPPEHRGLRLPYRTAATGVQLDAGSTVIVRGLRCLTAERLILDAPLFGFSIAEIENAIDSAIRLRLANE